MGLQGGGVVSNFKNLVFMTVLTTVCGFLLSFTDNLYKKFFTADAEIARKALVLFPELGGRLEGLDPQKLFSKAFEKLSFGKEEFFRLRQGLATYLKLEESMGMCGKIRLLVAYSPAMNQVIGIEVVSHGETPGLGSRIDEFSFKSQFKGLAAADGVKAGRRKNGDGEFDAITGATISSKAVEKIVNQAIQKIKAFAATSKTWK